MILPRVTEENFYDLLGQYVSQKYGSTLLDFTNACPYDMDFDDEELVHTQVVTWFVCERKNAFGRTVIEEFVDEFIDDEKLGSKILQMKNLVHDTFFIQRSVDARNIILVTAESTGRTFEVEVVVKNPDVYKEGRAFTGRIHPWHEDGTYRMAGIAKILISDEEMFARNSPIMPEMSRLHKQMLQEFQETAESITVSAKPKAVTLLRKLPIEWVNGICDSLNMDIWRCPKKEKIEQIASALTSKNFLEQVVAYLSEDEKIALRFVLKKGGSVKYLDLCRRVGKDDTEWEWFERSSSTVGRLRRHGLLVVGKKKIKTRSYKVAVIPADVAGILESCLR